MPADPRAAPPSRVVIAEDSRDTLSALAALLELEGHRIVTASDGAGAIETIVAERPNVAFVDVGLPGCDGYEVARRVRDRLGAAAPCLVALTGYGGPGDRGRGADAGFDIYLVKPVGYEELSAAVIEGLTRRERGSTAKSA